ncbi:MAG: putative salt-induced outer membrane protein [Paraglaciecola sp.]|jgi:putative salt-induced outer membrane protein
MSRYILLLIFTFPCHAQLNFMRSLYMTDTQGAIPQDPIGDISATGELGMLFTQGNTDSDNINGKFNISQEFQQWSYQTIARLRYHTTEEAKDGISNNVTTTQKNFISTQVDYKLASPDERIFLYAEYENDRFDIYDYQAIVASGWSEQLWRDSFSELKYSVGPGYILAEAVNKEENDDLQGLILRAALEFTLKVSKSAQISQFLITESDPAYTITKSETSLSTKIFGSLAMKLSFVMEHNSHAPAGQESLDTETSVTLVYQFF